MSSATTSRQTLKKPATPQASARPSAPSLLLQRKTAEGDAAGMDEECDECNKGLGVQRLASGTGGPAVAPPIVHEVLRSPGQPLDAGTRAFMEPRFGHEFSRVRVHTDAPAVQSAREINALAYTVGHHVVFGPNQFAPGTATGSRLLAHELTHVVQQSHAPEEQGRLVDAASSHSEFEREAQRVGAGEISPRSQMIPEAQVPRHIQRQDEATVAPDPTHRLVTDDQKAGIRLYVQQHQVLLQLDQNRAWVDGQSTTVDDLIAGVRADTGNLLSDNDVIADYIDTLPEASPPQDVVGAALTPDPTHQVVSDDQKAQIDLYLQNHQVSLLRDQNRAWIDGEGTTIDDLIARVRADTGNLLSDNDAIASYIDSQFYRFGPLAPAANRFNLPPILPDLGPHLLPEDRQRILDFLTNGGFGVGPSLSPVFGGVPVALDDLISQAQSLVLPIIPRDEVAAVVSGQWSQLLMEALTHVPLPPPPPFVLTPPDAAKDPDLQSTVGGQWTWHLNRAGSVERTVQVSFQRGSEAYQFGLNLDTGDVQALVGAQLQQETSTTKILGISLKAAAFLQLLGGITTARGEASGSLTFQVQAGVQVTATLGPISVSVQLAPSLTLQPGKDPALDFNVAPQGGADKLTPGAFPPLLGIPLIQGQF